MQESIRILAMNPGSTSTKIAVFENQEKVFSLNITHEASKLNEFKVLSDQFPYRRDMIVDALTKEGYALEDFAAFVGRGGGVNPCAGGTYEVNDLMLEHVTSRAVHPATLGPALAHEFAKTCGKKAFIVNPPDVDEFEPIARVSGIASIPRNSSFHALSHKEVALRAAEKLGKAYNETNLVVAHIGGGVSVAAHKKGRVVDASDILHGGAPMAPTRAGMISPAFVVELCFSGDYTEQQMNELFLKNGGIVDHLGTSDVLEVKKRIAEGDQYAKLIYDAMLYQVGKSIGSFAAVLHGKVDAVVLTGGISQDNYLVETLTEMIGYIAPIIVYPGELEMEALANGALRVILGQDTAAEYTGESVWKGFDQYKKNPERT